jgi:monothiol glutaredoxin
MNHRLDSPFQIAAGGMTGGGIGVDALDRSLPPLDRVARLVGSSEVFLFIKGSPQQPQCGFSANTVAIMNGLGVPYATFDVLSDPEIRAAAKQYAGWPTFPQVYVRGELVGGHDIVTEMLSTGELERLVREVRR